VRQPSAIAQAGNDGDAGSVVVEFALVALLVLTLLFGVISYGVILAVQQTVDQAAAEAARAGVPLGCMPGPADCSQTSTRATAQAASSAGWLSGSSCNAPVTCTVTFLQPCPNNPSPTSTCIRITVAYDWGGSPIIPTFVPTPSTIKSTSVAIITQ